MQHTTTITFPAPPAATVRALRAAASLLLDLARRIDAEHPQHPEHDAPPRTDVRPCPHCGQAPRSVYPPKTYTTSAGRTQTRSQAYCHRCQKTYSLPLTKHDRTTPNRAR